MKTCIAVLTRGYKNIDNYLKLITRNKHIEKYLKNKTIDILIFHEGNITNGQQIHISSKTPSLNIIFVNITGKAFTPEKKMIKLNPNVKIGVELGYRHMCSFWFVDFWKFVDNYDYLLRIDEDCFVNFNIDDIFVKLNDKLFIAGRSCNDAPSVTIGLNELTLNFIKNNSNNYAFKKNIPKHPNGPYTNLFGLSLGKIRKNEIFKKYVKKIETSDKIYERRWGDLPLFGEVIYYIFGEDTLLLDKSIKYFHGSHNKQVN